MRQGRLVAGSQHEHLPSEESSKESQLIHPGHTNISSSYYWVGCWGFFFPSFSFFPSAQQIWRLLGRHHSHRDGAVVSRGMEGPPGMLLLAPAQGLQVGVVGKEGTSARAGNKVHVLGTHTEQTHKVIPVPQFPCPQLHGGDSLVLPGAARWGQDTHGLAIHISSLLLGRRGAGGSHLFLGGSAPASP